MLLLELAVFVFEQDFALAQNGDLAGSTTTKASKYRIRSRSRIEMSSK